jgi:hypothetical protein
MAIEHKRDTGVGCRYIITDRHVVDAAEDRRLMGSVRILEVLVSNVGLETNCPDCGFS